MHRLEDWGRRQLATDPENPQSSLCSDEHRGDCETLEELRHAFKFNDAVLRHLTVKMDRASDRQPPR